MKKLLLIFVAGLAAYHFMHQKARNGVENSRPTYAEMRVQLEAGNRQIDMALFAKMENDEDCRQRTEAVWSKVIADCPNCSMKFVDCKPDLAPRHAMLFDDSPHLLTYLSMNHGLAGERDGRLIFFGLTAEESNQVCDHIQPILKKRYYGVMRCIRPPTA